MNLTDHHAKYFAHELTKRCPSDSVNKLASAVAGAQVDLNPHQVDMRSALVDCFREDGRIMIATEADTEGINLQFFSLVVNYDLPWTRTIRFTSSRKPSSASCSIIRILNH